MGKHTELPWVIPTQRDPQAVQIDAPMGDADIGHARWNGFIVCYGCDDNPAIGAQKARANAEFVVRAATYHHRLADALRDCLAAMDHMGDVINAMDAVTEEDEKYFPAFTKARILLTELGETE